MQISFDVVADDAPELPKELRDKIAAHFDALADEVFRGGYPKPNEEATYIWLDSSGRIRSSREAIPVKRCNCRGIVHMCCVT